MSLKVDYRPTYIIIPAGIPFAPPGTYLVTEFKRDGQQNPRDPFNILDTHWRIRFCDQYGKRYMIDGPISYFQEHSMCPTVVLNN